MDNGEVIPGLNEDWTFAGAKMMEWMCGFMSLMIVSSFLDKPAKWAPILCLIMVTMTLGMAALRRQFPDEERGLRNALMVSLGFHPPGLPVPALLQPYWSGAPQRQLDAEKEFMTLGLDKVFPGTVIDLEDDNPYPLE